MPHPLLPRVLRISSALTTGLAEGGRTAQRTIGLTLEDLSYLSQDGSLTLDVISLLHKTRDGLSMTPINAVDTSPEPFRALIPLSQAILRLADPPIPSDLTFPLELISHIIDFAQVGDNYELRQRTNLALSYVSRDVYRLVRPILRREIHITRGSQLQGLDKVRKEDPARRDEVRLVTMALNPSDLRRQLTGSWTGKLVEPVSHWLLGQVGEERGGKTFRLLDGSTAEEVYNHQDLPFALGQDLFSASTHLWPDAPAVDEAQLYSPHAHPDEDAVYNTVFFAEHTKRVLFHDTTPKLTARIHFDHINDPLTISPRLLEILAVPHAAVYPSDLLALLAAGSEMRLLAITLVFPAFTSTTADIATERQAFTTLFARLAPTLRRLTLRVRNHETRVSSKELTAFILSTISSLPNLHSLSFGGTGLTEPAKGFFYHLAGPTIEDLVVDKIASDSVHRMGDGISDVQISHQDGAMLVLRDPLWKGSLRRLEVWLHVMETPLAELDEQCEARGIQLVLRETPDLDWLRFHNA